MKRLVWHGNHNFVLEQTSGPLPVPAAHEVLLKIRAVGICGTDIHILRGNVPFSRPPLVLGHEISGEVVAIGDGVVNVQKGDRVTLDAVSGCGHCDLCQRNSAQFCAQNFEYGIHRNGGCQDYLLVPARNVYPIPDSMSFEEAAILDIEVYNAIRKCQFPRGANVLILGAGPIGLIACQVARILGSGPITLCEEVEQRLAVAKSIGLASHYTTRVDNEACFDLVIDCAGTGPSLKTALAMARFGGQVLLYGVHENPVEGFDVNQIVLKDLVVFGAQSDRDGWKTVIDLATHRTLDLKCLITHVFPLEEAQRAYDLVARREDSVVKAVLLI